MEIRPNMLNLKPKDLVSEQKEGISRWRSTDSQLLPRSFGLNRLPSARRGEHQVFPPARHAYLSDVVSAVLATDGFDGAHVQPSKDL